uniref:Secreted protein n=1 Tax=Panagrolaimus superbus TaxID=310955 RepID=A0A914YP97_9BILA
MRFILFFLLFLSLFLVTVVDGDVGGSITTVKSVNRWIWDEDAGKWVSVPPALADPSDYDNPGQPKSGGDRGPPMPLVGGRHRTRPRRLDDGIDRLMRDKMKN